MTKKLLIAAFISRNEIEQFLKQIYTEFDIESDKVFIYENLDDDSQYVATFFINLNIGEKVFLQNYFKNALIVHKKKKTFYTINALNKLIEKEHNLDKGNIDYKNWKIDWSKFQNKIIINSNNKLVLIGLKRFFL
jgi:hypothetical protein|tara:strand:+ start:615 stop:1019 length:405 start_codon:yes stop_codon:yes gene_type:complete